MILWFNSSKLLAKLLETKNKKTSDHKKIKNEEILNTWGEFNNASAC